MPNVNLPDEIIVVMKKRILNKSNIVQIIVMKYGICIVNLQMLHIDGLINTSFAAFPRLLLSYQCLLIINHIQHEAT
jgi:hypothetical protein